MLKVYLSFFSTKTMIKIKYNFYFLQQRIKNNQKHFFRRDLKEKFSTILFNNKAIRRKKDKTKEIMELKYVE